ncbi:E3 ubiquitin-protein ligase RNF139 isoform X1 [Gadus macrocephalus]|uniref:E3 ubiquitin-protein ligase RNF139 isoform X1 n=1 Tax=Gadus macrocephalus TaxID=80720 RepID=UPI0028CB9986|nr:E3 ubiquitin-protein ligase RNF139 isoform X1 [Gadus macrocephalus]
MAVPQARLSHRLLAGLDVALRVPCVFIIDGIFNSSYEPSGSGWAGAGGRVLLRVLGVLAACVVLLLSQKALFKFYTLFLAAVVGAAGVLINYHATAQRDVVYGAYHKTALGFRLLPRSGPTLWLGVAAVQMALGVGYIFLLRLQSSLAALVVAALLAPLWGLVVELPGDGRQLLALGCGALLGLQLAGCLALRLPWLYYSGRYVYLLLRHMYRIYGLQLLLEDTWKRVRLPHVLRLFWLSRLAAQALILLYVVQAARREDAAPPAAQGAVLSGEVLWEVLSNLVISGCDSTLTVLGMSAVISSLAHYLGLCILLFIGSTEEEDKRLGFVAPVLFFILALQTGLSSLDPDERLVRLSRNMCLLLTAVLHFIHGMTEPVLMSLSASHTPSLRRHLPVLLVSLALFLLPVVLSYFLWNQYALNTWLFAVTAFCVELCLKVVVSVTVYVLFMADGVSSVLWEGLDDYVYGVRSAGSVLEFLFGVVMFANGAYTMVFESGSKIRACMMCLHAYFNIYLQARNGWRTFVHRRSAAQKINSLPEARGRALRELGDVCAICYQEFSGAARVTPCRHYFHAPCLRKWLYIQDSCPMCHQRVYVEEPEAPPRPFSDRDAAPAAAAALGRPRPPAPPPPGEEPGGGGAEEPQEEIGDNDSIEYDEEEWGARSGGGGAPQEEQYLDEQEESD